MLALVLLPLFTTMGERAGVRWLVFFTSEF